MLRKSKRTSLGQPKQTKPQPEHSRSKGKLNKSKSKDKLRRILGNKLSKKQQSESNQQTTSHTFCEKQKRRRSSQLAVQDELLKHQKQITLVLNSLATKIQALWRGYKTRKRLFNVKIDKASSVSEFSEKDAFNNRKYFQCSSLSRLCNFARTQSKQQSYKQLSLQRIEQPKYHPDADQSANSNISESKSTSIKIALKDKNTFQSNVINVSVEPALITDKFTRFNEVYIDTPKTGFTELLGKCQTLLEQKRIAKLMELENKLARNKLTERTYLQLNMKAEDSYRRESEFIRERKTKYKMSWKDVYELYKAQKQHHFSEDSISYIERSGSWLRGDKEYVEIQKVLDDFVSYTSHGKQSSQKQDCIPPQPHPQTPLQLQQNLLSDDNHPILSTPITHSATPIITPFQTPSSNNIIIVQSNTSLSDVSPVKLPTEKQQQVLSINIHDEIVVEVKESRLEQLIAGCARKNQPVDANDLTSQILELMVTEFLESIARKFFLMSSIKLLKVFKKPPKKQKSPPIDTTIDSINNWLLQVAHFILDYHRDRFQHNIQFPSILPPSEFLHGKPIYPVQSISLQIFSEFQYYYIKRIKETTKVKPKQEEQFTNTLQVHDLCLYNALNQAINNETGLAKEESYAIWTSRKSTKKKIPLGGGKGMLQRAINVVSQWAEACLGISSRQDQPSIRPAYTQQQIYAVIEVLQIPLYSIKLQTQISLALSLHLEQYIMNELTTQLMSFL